MSVVSTLLAILGILLLSLLGLLLLLVLLILLVPFGYKAAGRKYETAELIARVSWLWGAVRLALNLKQAAQATRQAGSAGQVAAEQAGQARQARQAGQEEDAETGTGRSVWQLSLALVLAGIRIPLHFDTDKKKEAKTAAVRKKEKEKAKEKKKKNSALSLLQRKDLGVWWRIIRKVLAHIAPRRFRVRGRFGFEDPAYTGWCCAVMSLLQTEWTTAHIRVRPVFEEPLLEGTAVLSGRIIMVVPVLVALRQYIPYLLGKWKQHFMHREAVNHAN